MTPLHWAAKNGAIEAVAYLLLTRNVSVNAQTRLNEVALHFAVRRNSVEILRMLLDQGADVNAPNHEGRTPLHLAVIEEKVMCVDELLKAPEVRPNLRDRDGVSFIFTVLLWTLLRPVRIFSLFSMRSSPHLE
jgi:ankyrin repeat protein